MKYLFSTGYLLPFLQSRAAAKLVYEIKTDDFDTKSDEEIINGFLFRPLCIRRDTQKILEPTGRVPNQPLIIEAKYTYTGDPALWDMKPEHGTVFPRGEIIGNVLKIEVCCHPKEAMNYLSGALNKIDAFIDNQRPHLERYNEQIQNELAILVPEHRSWLEQKRQLCRDQ